MTRWFLALLVLMSMLPAAGRLRAVELQSPPVVKVEGQSATITWRTDVACGTRLNYGRDLAKLDQKVEGEVTASHSVKLDGLAQGATYYFSVGSARQKLSSGSFTVTGAGMAPSAEAAPAPAAKSPGARSPPPTRETWGRMDTLQDHFDRHGRDFQSATPDAYAAQAWQLLQRAKAGELPMKWDASDGTLRVFDPKTRAFAAYNRDGTTKTCFRPNSADYWQRQPGKPVKPADLPF